MIGAPTDIGASARGASMGPEALRVAGLRDTLQAQGLEVHDCGNLRGPHNPCLPPVDGYRHLAEVTAWNQLAHDAVHGELQAGHLPILLGGDHSLAIGSISAVARHCRANGKRLRVLWLDAHADFNTNQLTPSGNVHGMPVACLCGYGPAGLTGMAGARPALESGYDPADRHSQRGPGREALRARGRARGVRHALHRRDGHASHAASSHCWDSTATRTCTSASTWTSSTRTLRPEC